MKKKRSPDTRSSTTEGAQKGHTEHWDDANFDIFLIPLDQIMIVEGCFVGTIVSLFGILSR